MTKSRFPGMDPYLESHWLDVHSKLVAYTSDALNEVLPPDLIARSEERLVIEADAGARRVAPDVRIYRDPTSPFYEADPQPDLPDEGGGAATPVLVFAQIEAATQTYVTVVDANTDQLVTCIEYLSPTNKRASDGLREYCGKRDALLVSGVNIVEIDLQRVGNWKAVLWPFEPSRKHYSTYRAVVRRAAKREQIELYPISIRSSLPKVPIPLRAADPELHIDLQELLDRSYKNGRYFRTDYSKPCEPPLTPELAAWADGLLKAAGKK